MKTKTKRGLLLGTVSLVAVALGVTVIGRMSGENGLTFIGRSEAVVQDASIVFSRDSGTFTKIDNSTASISGTTASGATYYAISHNSSDISETDNIAQWGVGDSESLYISFSTNPTGTDDFEFQAIKAIKVYTTSASDQNIYVQYSTNGTSFSGSETVSASTSPSKVTFDSSHKYIRVTKAYTASRTITKIELFYDCSTGGEKTVNTIAVEGAKVIYAQDSSFVEPNVRAYYSDSTNELVSGAVFSGFDSSSLTESQTITVTFGGKSTSYNIKVRPTESSKLISYKALNESTYDFDELSDFLDLNNSTIPTYGEPGYSVSITPSLKAGWNIDFIAEEDELVTPVESSGTYSFTMINSDLNLVFYHYYTPYATGIRVDNPKTSYNVGDNFVEPAVYKTMSDSSEQLISSGLTFSGFDSSSEAASQTITVSYNNGEFSTTYTISVTSETPVADEFVRTSYTFVQNATYSYVFNFSSETSGTYARYSSGSLYAMLSFTYTYNESTKTITMTFKQFEVVGSSTSSNSNFGNYRFSSSTPTTATKLTANYSNGVVTTTLYNYSGQNANPTIFER